MPLKKFAQKSNTRIKKDRRVTLFENEGVKKTIPLKNRLRRLDERLEVKRHASKRGD